MNGETTQVASTQTNDVWKTLGGFATALGDIYIKSETLKASRASAAPGGASTMPPAPANPFAGFWSANPQNDTKQQYQNASPFAGMAINPLWLILLAALGLLLVFNRR